MLTGKGSKMGLVSFSSEWSLLKVTFLVLFSPSLVSGSHFRGGVITWRPVSNIPPAPGTFPTVLFNYRVAFRTSFSSDHFCDQGTISSGTINPGEGFLQCDNGCTTLNDDFDYRCTDFSAEADWTTGVGDSTFTPTTNMFEVFYEGRNWITLTNGGNGRWVIRSRVDLTPRPDNGLLNSSPTTTNMPIVRIPLNCPVRLSIPVTDPDGDVVRCRYAETTGDECGTICGELDAALDEDSCILEWTPPQIGLFGVAIQIEDFVDASSTTPLSSIPLQFLFEVFQGEGGCEEAPVFDPVVLPDESCIAVRQGGTFTTRVQAVVSNPLRRIVSISTVSPIGLTTTPVQPVPGSDVAYFIDIIFTTPTTSQQQEIFCFVAEDDGGLTSEQRCIFLVTATPPPTAVTATADDNNLLTITVDGMIRRPDSSRFIHIVSASTQQTLFTFDSSSATEVTFPVSGTTVQIQLPTGLPAGDTYQASLDRGAIESNDFCGVENEPTSLAIMADTVVDAPCPQDIFVNISDGETVAFVSWVPPNPGGGATQVAGPSASRGFYAAGTNMTIRYIFRSQINTFEKCQFSVVVGPDPHPCPANIFVSALRGTGGAIVTWTEPATEDQLISRSLPPGAFFSPGVTCVSYAYTNQLGEVATCTFEVEIEEVSPCDDYPCENDGTCLVSSIDEFQCFCSESCYTGDYCEIPVHACVNKTCLNDGACQLFEDSCTVSACKCPPCYTGEMCETFLDPCSDHICQNGGECTIVDGACDRYTCECEGCFYGVFCQNEVPDPCMSDPCLPEFTCARNYDNCNGYICLSERDDIASCIQGGVEIYVQDRCVSSPCENGATCIPTSPADADTDDLGYTCLCPDGYAGRQCSEDIDNYPQLDLCTPTTCMNFGTCYNSYTSFSDSSSPEYTCICTQGFSGVNCSQPIAVGSPCLTNGIGTCQNIGICRDMFISPSNDVNFFCDCRDGFIGSRCDVQVDDPCVSAPCRNGGSCTRDGASFTCNCNPLFTGSTCEVELRDVTPPLILNCPEPIILNSDAPVEVMWVWPTVLDLTTGSTGGSVQLVSANAAPGAFYNPGDLKEVELVYENFYGGRSACEFWIYINPLTQ